MELDRKDTPATRRRFLLGAGAVGAAGAAVVVAKGAAVPAAPAGNGQAEAGGSGYRMTEHVRNYYRTTKI